MSQGMSPGYGQPAPSSGLSIASMVLGIVSLVLFCFWYVSIPCAIIAIVLGFIARGKVKAGTGGAGGMAMAGIVCASISILLAVLLVAGVLAFLGLGGTKVLEDMQRELEKQQQQQQQQQNQPQGMLDGSALFQTISYATALATRRL
jgi:hypothetical protein